MLSSWWRASWARVALRAWNGSPAKVGLMSQRRRHLLLRIVCATGTVESGGFSKLTAEHDLPVRLTPSRKAAIAGSANVPTRETMAARRLALGTINLVAAEL